jgi:hypothetical protein
VGFIRQFYRFRSIRSTQMARFFRAIKLHFSPRTKNHLQIPQISGEFQRNSEPLAQYLCLLISNKVTTFHYFLAEKITPNRFPVLLPTAHNCLAVKSFLLIAGNAVASLPRRFQQVSQATQGGKGFSRRAERLTAVRKLTGIPR